jgi:hypothetical protein
MPRDEYFLEGPKNQIRTFCLCAIDCLQFLWREVVNPDQPDPSLFLGSGSFHHQEKNVRKNLISTVLRLLYDFLILKNDVPVL